MRELTATEIRTARQVHDGLTREALAMVDENYSGLSDEMRVDLTVKQAERFTARFLRRFHEAHGPAKTRRMVAALHLVADQG